MINIKIGDKKDPRTQAELVLRKSIAGDLIIEDHEDIDIVIMNEKNKVVAFSKETMNDFVYETQDRLFKFLQKRGVVNPETVRCGNVYGSMEAELLNMNENIPGNSKDYTLLSISRWMDEERPNFLYTKAAEEEFEKELLKPDAGDTTALGEIPPEPKRARNYVKGAPFGQFNTRWAESIERRK